MHKELKREIVVLQIEDEQGEDSKPKDMQSIRKFTEDKLALHNNRSKRFSISRGEHNFEFGKGRRTLKGRTMSVPHVIDNEREALILSLTMQNTVLEEKFTKAHETSEYYRNQVKELQDQIANNATEYLRKIAGMEEDHRKVTSDFDRVLRKWKDKAVKAESESKGYMLKVREAATEAKRLRDRYSQLENEYKLLQSEKLKLVKDKFKSMEKLKKVTTGLENPRKSLRTVANCLEKAQKNVKAKEEELSQKELKIRDLEKDLGAKAELEKRNSMLERMKIILETGFQEKLNLAASTIDKLSKSYEVELEREKAAINWSQQDIQTSDDEVWVSFKKREAELELLHTSSSILFDQQKRLSKCFQQFGTTDGNVTIRSEAAASEKEPPILSEVSEKEIYTLKERLSTLEFANRTYISEKELLSYTHQNNMWAMEDDMERILQEAEEDMTRKQAEHEAEIENLQIAQKKEREEIYRKGQDELASVCKEYDILLKEKEETIASLRKKLSKSTEAPTTHKIVLKDTIDNLKSANVRTGKAKKSMKIHTRSVSLQDIEDEIERIVRDRESGTNHEEFASLLKKKQTKIDHFQKQLNDADGREEMIHIELHEDHKNKIKDVELDLQRALQEAENGLWETWSTSKTLQQEHWECLDKQYIEVKKLLSRAKVNVEKLCFEERLELLKCQTQIIGINVIIQKGFIKRIWMLASCESGDKMQTANDCGVRAIVQQKTQRLESKNEKQIVQNELEEAKNQILRLGQNIAQLQNDINYLRGITGNEDDSGAKILVALRDKYAKAANTIVGLEASLWQAYKKHEACWVEIKTLRGERDVYLKRAENWHKRNESLRTHISNLKQEVRTLSPLGSPTSLAAPSNINGTSPSLTSMGGSSLNDEKDFPEFKADGELAKESKVDRHTSHSFVESVNDTKMKRRRSWIKSPISSGKKIKGVFSWARKKSFRNKNNMESEWQASKKGDALVKDSENVVIGSMI